jgi:hypothetical protein
MPFRFATALRHYAPKLKYIPGWTFSSRETTNFTYEITVKSGVSAHTISSAECLIHGRWLSSQIQEERKVKRHVVERVRRRSECFR